MLCTLAGDLGLAFLFPLRAMPNPSSASCEGGQSVNEVACLTCSSPEHQVQVTHAKWSQEFVSCKWMHLAGSHFLSPYCYFGHQIHWRLYPQHQEMLRWGSVAVPDATQADVERVTNEQQMLG